MDGMLDPHDRRLAEAWETLKAHYDKGDSLEPESISTAAQALEDNHERCA
jgi:hypothetical protein